MRHRTTVATTLHNAEPASSDDWFRGLCDDASDLIQSVSPEGRFIYVNRAWKNTLEYDDDQIEQLHVFDIIHPDSRSHCETVMREVMSGHPSTDIRADFVTRYGRRVHVEGSASLRMRGGRPDATVGIFRDVTDRVNAKDQLDQLFNLSTDMLCVAGLDGFFKQINPAFEKTLGFSEKELLSRSFLDFVHPDDRASTIAEVERLSQGLITVDFQNRYLDKDGAYHWMSWRATPMADKGLVYAIARDVTQQMRVKEELARSNADLEQFAYAASHDLRAPLRNIALLTEWIEEDMVGRLSPKAQEHLTTLRGRLQRMDALVEDLLSYSRVGRETNGVVSVDTAAVIHDVTELLAPPTGFAIVVQPPMPVVHTQRAPFEQVIRNLIGNALKHHDRAEGRIVVSAKQRDGLWEFSVADDGPGVPAEFHDRVFQMFQKLRSSDEVEGTGMGLALVRRIVEVNGGAIRLESSGRGTTVRFTWPARRERT